MTVSRVRRDKAALFHWCKRCDGSRSVRDVVRIDLN
jgi:hypothetical protein